MKKDPNKYPPGLNAAKVRRIIRYYDNQNDAEAAAEIERAPQAPSGSECRGDLCQMYMSLLLREKKPLNSHFD